MAAVTLGPTTADAHLSRTGTIVEPLMPAVTLRPITADAHLSQAGTIGRSR